MDIKIISHLSRFGLCGMLMLWNNSGSAQEAYSSYMKQTYSTRVYWGDTHLHSNLSVDAYLDGNKLLDPEEAYRFAKGEVVARGHEMTAQLYRPLDFLVVADHAASLGLLTGLQNADPLLLQTASGKQLYEQWQSIQDKQNATEKKEAMTIFGWKKLFPLFATNRDRDEVPRVYNYARSIWKYVVESADKHNDPGKFTTLIGYEWTSPGAEKFGNLHRVVLFKDGGDKVGSILPFSMLDSKDPEDLWQFMASYETNTGGDVLAIPHNANLSSGEMFSLADFSGAPLSSGYAKTRSRWEPLYEVTQTKGDSETHPTLSPKDEFADFETWDDWPWLPQSSRNTNQAERRPSKYARSALKLGLDQKTKIGINPFKFGMIGSSDAHGSLAAVDEDNFWGKSGKNGPSPKRMFAKPYGWNLSASGYAAVWATENTREALFAAMKRKEVYASTGPRMTVRFFGGWDYKKNDALQSDLVRIGYQGGVPMGGDLTNGPEGKAPRFLIRATKDPDGANLDRVQIIKGWRSGDGELHEKIVNVALSDGRTENGEGKTSPVGNTVSIANASYTNSIGDPELAIVWQDPDFNKDELAFYYVRVMEIPTPRWTAYDAKFFKINDVPPEVPMVTQERAYTSPIWYKSLGATLMKQAATLFVYQCLDTRAALMSCANKYKRKKINDFRLSIGCVLINLIFCLSCWAEVQVNYSPYTKTDFPMTVYWGDTHLHTNMSIDTNGKSLSPVDAYRFARGETVTAYNGTPMRRQRPLDFLVVADHAENIGLYSAMLNNDSVLLSTEEGRRLHKAYTEAIKTGDKSKLYPLLGAYGYSGKTAGGEPFIRSVWDDITANADEYNDPGNFTAFIGYEWTSWGTNPESSGQLHRVVIFEDGAERTRKALPYSQIDSNKPEDLWAHLARYEKETGGDAIAIPHNGNLSVGRMFMLEDSAGDSFTQSYAKTRSRWEPLFEVTQIKGDSETHPFLSPNDEFADYETFIPFKEVELINERRQFEYARSGLKLGLDQDAKLGINPFKFGMIGSTDAHGGLSSVAENNFNGKILFMEPSAERITKNYTRGNGYRTIPSWQLSAAGYAAVWAHENSRESLFAAMKRKEVYATTGPRITVRFFGGWNYQASDALRPDLGKTGYNKGVPMGGDLTDPPNGKSPSFLIRAIKDPDGANLDRIQVIKGWRDKNGELLEKIYTVAVSEQRKTDRNGNVALVGSTVNISDATYTNNIGNAELAIVWKDPEFNKNDLAFYYARVLEIPTPRWPAYDANVFDLKEVPDEVSMVIQERAYTSPIWYSPTR